MKKLNTKLASSTPSAAASRRLAEAVAAVRTQMGHRGLDDGRLAAVSDALRAHRSGDRLLGVPRLPGLQGGS